MPGLVKVGRTTRSSKKRASELSNSTSVPTKFAVAYEGHFVDCVRAEKRVHEILSNKGYRVSGNREFFEAPLNEVIAAIKAVQGPVPETERKQREDAAQREEARRRARQEAEEEARRHEARRLFSQEFDRKQRKLDEALEFMAQAEAAAQRGEVQRPRGPRTYRPAKTMHSHRPVVTGRIPGERAQAPQKFQMPVLAGLFLLPLLLATGLVNPIVTAGAFVLLMLLLKFLTR